MKKMLALILGLAVVTSAFTACGSSDSSSKSETSSSSSEEAATTEAATSAGEEATAEEGTTEAAEEEENYNTGDASLDNVRNQDEIGEKELLVLSFGTSYNDSRRLTIGAIEDSLEKAFPEFSVRRGFTANIIIDHVNKRDGILIDDVDAAMKIIAGSARSMGVEVTD